MLLAGVVHLISAAIAVGSVWLLIVGPLVPRILGVIGLMVTVLNRPRLGRYRQDTWSLSRAEAPHLYGLADRIAAELAVRPVDLIRVTPYYDTHYGRFGLRRRSVLTIGLALWEVLNPQERVALLAHDFGHDRNGDSRRGLWLHSASATLAHWHSMTRAGEIIPVGSYFLTIIAHVIARVLLFIPNKLTELSLFLLYRLTLRSGQRAEYLADDLAARVASSAATRSMLEALVLGQSVEILFQRQTALHQKGGFRPTLHQESDVDLWQELREHIRSIPATERLRQLRISALRMSAVDTTHPPTHLRIQMMNARRPREAAIVLDAQENAAITAELAPLRTQAAQAVLTAEY